MRPCLTNGTRARRAYREMQLAAIAGPVNEERAAQFHKEQICAIKS